MQIKAVLNMLSPKAHLHMICVYRGYVCVCRGSTVITRTNVAIIRSICVPHPTIFAFVKYLRGERVPRGRPGLLRNILPHPLPVGLVGCDVTLLEFDLIGRQETHHVLLLLFNLHVGGGGTRERMTEGKLSVRHVLTSAL